MLQWLTLGISVLAYLDAKEHREWQRSVRGENFYFKEEFKDE